MKQLEGSLKVGNAVSGRRIHILHGLGGIGKTQLAIAYARKHQESYDAILWLNGNSRDTLLQSFAAFGRYANLNLLPEATASTTSQADKLEAEAQAVLKWLALPGNKRWLMIVDNVDREYSPDAENPHSFDILSFLPFADHGCVLITTRLLSLKEIGRSTEISKLDLEQALELLSDRSALPRNAIGMKYMLSIYSQDTRLTELFPGMEELVKRLGYLPLALVQSGKYMMETGTSCPKYSELYASSWSRLVAEVPRLRDDENGNIHTTWMISYERVAHANPTAAKLLQLWSNLDYRDVWYELIHRGSQGCLECSWFQDLAQDEISFKEIIKTLLAYSLVESHRDIESYSIHPVVHDWCSETISYSDAGLVVLACTVIGFAVPDRTEPEYWLSEQRLIPHADRCIQRLYQLNSTNAIEYSQSNYAFHNLALLYEHQGKMAEAEEMYQRALSGKEKAWGPEHISTLNTVNNLGNLYANQGKMVEAEEMYQRALSGYEKARGPEHTSTLDTVNNLGVLYANQGKTVEAEEIYQRALSGYEKAWGPEHISTLDTVNNLGNLYVNQGKMAEAEEIYQRALSGKEKAWGPEHISTLNTVNNLGLLYADQGKTAEAEEMYQRALSGYEKAWGLEHMSTLDTVNNLGVLYKSQGKIVEAEEMYQRALSGYEKAWGPEHISTLNTVNNLGNLYKNQGKMVEAEEMYQRALSGYEKAWGPEHTSTLSTVHNLGFLYADQGKMVEAEEMYQRALSGYEKARGPEHTSTLDTVNNLGNLYADQGKTAEAEEMYQRSLSGYEKARGPEHTSTLDTVNNLGVLYADQGKMVEAEEMYQRSLSGYEKAWGPEHTSTLDTVNNLGRLYANQGKMVEAEEMYQRALSGYLKFRGPDHPVTMRIRRNLIGLKEGSTIGDRVHGAAEAKKHNCWSRWSHKKRY